MITASNNGAYQHLELKSEQLALIDRVGVLARDTLGQQVAKADGRNGKIRSAKIA